jgi:hypothetical protein
MADVIGPNGARAYIPDDVAACLVGDGSGEYRYAPEPEPEADKPKAPVKRTTTRRKTTA